MFLLSHHVRQQAEVSALPRFEASNGDLQSSTNTSYISKLCPAAGWNQPTLRKTSLVKSQFLTLYTKSGERSLVENREIIFRLFVIIVKTRVVVDDGGGLFTYTWTLEQD